MSALVSDCTIARAFGPHTPSVVIEEVRSCNCAVPSAGQAIGEPLSVRHPVGTTGDDAEMVRSQSHDRQVGAEPAPPGVSTGV